MNIAHMKKVLSLVYFIVNALCDELTVNRE